MINKYTLVLALILTSAVAQADCADDYKKFKEAEAFGATNFTCEDHYDGSTSSSWEISKEDYARYREYLDQLKIRRKK